jgi:hypothetical protein
LHVCFGTMAVLYARTFRVMAKSSASGPDFLCIGMQKAGTAWLYDQLETHPDFWMPPLKELHFFDKALETRAAGRLLPRVQSESPG